MANLKALAILGGAAAIGGVAATVGVPMAASKMMNVNDPKNWWGPGTLAIGAGLAVIALGEGKPAALAAGAAIAGVGGSWAWITYQNTHKAPAQATSGIVGNAWRGNPARFSGARAAGVYQGAGVRQMQYG
jgi:hypothetical protein